MSQATNPQGYSDQGHSDQGRATTLQPGDLARLLRASMGEDAVSTDPAECLFFSTDTLSEGHPAEAVIRPKDAAGLAAAIACVIDAGGSIVGRGGGFSYSGGYTPTSAGCVIVDMRSLNRIIEINTEDLYVVVEAGCTWMALFEALKATGYRTPYFGPMSGHYATVGGALSQGSFFLGSTQYGTTADSVLAVEVALADGRLVQTGSASNRHAPSPFFRHYGPDLTGLFLHDCGAMGVKTKAMLRLIPFPEHSRFATLRVPELASAVGLVSAISRSGLASECYAWDPALVARYRTRNTIKDDFQYLKGVAQTGGSFWEGLRNAGRLVSAGKSEMKGEGYLVHVVIDDTIPANADNRMKAVHEIGASFDAMVSNGAIPRALRGNPFANFLQIQARAPDVRSLPMSALVPHSKALAAAELGAAHFEALKPELDALGITISLILFGVGSTVMCVEPIANWSDRRATLHDRVSSRSDLDALAADCGPPEATAFVIATRAALADKLLKIGAAWVQIGRAFPYREGRSDESLALLDGVKALVDPTGRMNPGVLGFHQDA